MGERRSTVEELEFPIERAAEPLVIFGIHKCQHDNYESSNFYGFSDSLQQPALWRLEMAQGLVSANVMASRKSPDGKVASSEPASLRDNQACPMLLGDVIV